VRWCRLVRPPEPRDVHLGNYEVLLPLATGGIAEVSIARRVPGSGTPVVVKRVHRHLVRDRGFCNLLRDEARVASLIRHPNVVSVEELVDERGELVVVLPYIEGVSLAALLVGQGDAGEHGALPPAVASRILADVLAGLDAAHNAVDPKGRPLHVIHRDVSPENVLVGVDGTSRVIDFGIARVRERVSKTNAAALQAKLPYMAPELIEQRPVDPRADVFGAAAVLHEALSGRRAFDGRSDAEGASPRVGLGLGAALDDLLAQALARAPEARTASAGALRAALVALLPPAGAAEVAALVDRRCHESVARRRSDLEKRLAAPTPAKKKPNPFLTGQSRGVVFGSGLPQIPTDLDLDEPDEGDPEDKAVVFERERLQIAANDSSGSARPPRPTSNAPLPDPETLDPTVPMASPELSSPGAAPSGDGVFYVVNAVVSALALAFLGWLLVLRSGGAEIGVDVSFLPAVNATLNGLSATLLVVGYRAIRAKNPGLHKRAMMSAFVASALFLVTYVVYHYVHGDTKFVGTGALRGVYFFVLISHVLLSMAVVPLALTAFYFAFKKRFVSHRKVTRYALPIWLYVSVTGVLIFALLKASGSMP
jgi:uncharacterized membrane protein YozB (DUF420 family)/serine/threonine protein kinase